MAQWVEYHLMQGVDQVLAYTMQDPEYQAVASQIVAPYLRSKKFQWVEVQDTTGLAQKFTPDLTTAQDLLVTESARSRLLFNLVGTAILQLQVRLYSFCCTIHFEFPRLAAGNSTVE